MNGCPIIARLFGCKFEPRFDTKFSDRLLKVHTYAGPMDDLKDRAYVHDICVRCGKIVDRSRA